MAIKTTSSRYSGQLQFFDAYSYERVLPVSAFMKYEDFAGQAAVAIPAVGSATNGWEWVKKIVGSGPPTVAGVANAISGQVALTLLSTSEKEDAVLYWGDNLGIDTAVRQPYFEASVNLSVLPSASGVQAVWGLASVWIDGPNNNTCYMRFGCTANGNLQIQCFDGTTTTTYTTSTTLVAGAQHIYRIDASTLTDIRFYVDGVQVSTDNQVSWGATGTLAVLQPYFAVYKPSGAGLATLIVDHVRVWQNRN
jgi:hypothetical protein